MMLDSGQSGHPVLTLESSIGSIQAAVQVASAGP